MTSSVVVYESKYGSTKKYAQWIAKELSCDLFERKDMDPARLKDYDIIIYGGGLYAGGVSGISLITKSFDHIQDKKLILFTCGLADPNNLLNTRHIQEGLSKVFTGEMQRSIKVFHLRGAVDYARLGMVHKTMMAMLHKMISKKANDSLTDEEKQMRDTYGQCVDFTDKATIEPILSYVRSE